MAGAARWVFGDPEEGGASGGQGTGFRMARGQCLQERGIWGRGGSPNPETWRNREKDSWMGRERDRERLRERLRKKEMERKRQKETHKRERQTENPKDGALGRGGGVVCLPSLQALGCIRSALSCAQRSAGRGRGPRARGAHRVGERDCERVVVLHERGVLVVQHQLL